MDSFLKCLKCGRVDEIYSGQNVYLSTCLCKKILILDGRLTKNAKWLTETEYYAEKIKITKKRLYNANN